MRSFASLLVVLFITGCGSPSTPATGSFPLEVGPAGGVIEGAPGTEFDGVRLEIPAGALSTAVVIGATWNDEEPELGPGASFVGPSFDFRPRGQVFSKPVKLTLPVTPRALENLEQTTTDCLMWMRSVDGVWGQLSPVATTETSVTVEATTLVQSAVGAKQTLAIVPPVPLARPCSDPSGFCVTANPEKLRAGNVGWSALQGTRLLYRYAESDGGITRTFLAEYDVVLGRHTWTSAAYVPPASVPPNFAGGLRHVPNVARGPDDAGWSPVSHGLVRFPPSGAPTLFADSVANGKTVNVAFTADGRRHRQFLTGTPTGREPLVMRVSSTTANVEGTAVVLENDLGFSSQLDVPFFQVGAGNTLGYVYWNGSTAKVIELPNAPDAGAPWALHPAAAANLRRLDEFSVSPDGDLVATSINSRLTEASLYVQSRDGSVSRAITTPPFLSGIEFGEPGFLYVTASNAAHVYRVEIATGGMQTIELTSSSDPLEIAANTPVALRSFIVPATATRPAINALFVIVGPTSNRRVVLIKPATP